MAEHMLLANQLWFDYHSNRPGTESCYAHYMLISLLPTFAILEQTFPNFFSKALLLEF